MERLKSRSGAVQAVALLAIVLAFALRSATPYGYMLAASENGALAVTLCGGPEHKILIFDPETGTYSKLPLGPQAPDSGDDLDSSSCPFALSAAYIAPPPVIAPDVATISRDRLRAMRPGASDASLFPVRAPLPPRGPPTLV